MRSRWLFALIAIPLLASLIAISLLGRSIISDLEALSIAKNDNVSWNSSQLEVELLRTQNTIMRAQADPSLSLSEIRMRFDIFYSRVATMYESRRFGQLNRDPDAAALVARAKANLDAMLPLIDGPDDDLRAALPKLYQQLDDEWSNLRQLTLDLVQGAAAESSDRRKSISRTLITLGGTLLALILALFLALVIVLRLFRRGQRYAHDIMAARSRFEAAVKSSKDAVVVMDTAGRIVDFNGAGETVFGYSRQEAIGADMAELIVPEYLREKHRAGVQRFLKTGEQKMMRYGRVRLEGMRKSGEVFPVELSMSVAEADGEQVFVSFLRDITADLAAEDMLRAARDRAQESEKAKSDLLTVMSHEMRTPLNGILGSLSLIDFDELSERNKRHFKSIEISGELILSHVNDVLDLSNQNGDSPKRKKVAFDLRELVCKVWTSLRANAEARGNQMNVSFLTETPRVVLGYEIALQQCLVNLVGNAIKFTRDGVISIEVERLAHDDVVEIRVADTGIGMATEDLARIFDEFVTIDTAFSRENAGTGLGLAITRRLVDAMGATIEVDSISGEGSLFTMRIPLPEAGEMQRTEAKGSELVPAGIRPGQSALVVDDNEINRIVLTDMVSDLGFEVHQAADGLQAIEAVRHRPFDIVFLDISMPGIDGIDTLARIRALEVGWRNVPAVAVTAHVSPQDHDVILRADFSGLLVKPVDPAAIGKAVASVLGAEALPPRPASRKPDISEFEKRFGQERYQSAMKEFCAELTELLDTLETVPAPDEQHRRMVHRLSGSAATLGAHDAWRRLQQLQSLDEDPADGLKERLVMELRACCCDTER